MHSELLVNLALAGIDDTTRQILRETWPVVRVRVPQVLDALYGQGAFRPDLHAQFSNGSRVAEARAAQEKHWEALFSARFDEEYAASVSRIALTHVRVGLRPAWFISGYLVALSELHSLLVNAHGENVMSWRSRTGLEKAIRAVDKAVMFDLQLGVTAYCAEMDAGHKRRIEDLAERCAALADCTEDRVGAVAGEVESAIDGLCSACDLARADANDAQDGAVRIVSEVAATTAAVEHMTGLIHAAAGRSLQAAAATQDAITVAGDAARLLDCLRVAIGRAERLCGDSGEAAAPIRTELDAARAAISDVAGAVSRVQATVGKVHAATVAAAEAVAGQVMAARSVASASLGTEAATANLNRIVGSFARHAARIEAGTQRFTAASARLRQHASDQSAEMHDAIAGARATDRRAEAREPASASVILTTEDREIRGVLRDVSAGGASVLLDTATFPDEPGPMTIRLPQAAATTSVTVVGRTPSRLHLSFTDRAAAQPFMANALDRSNALEASSSARSGRRLVPTSG